MQIGSVNKTFMEVRKLTAALKSIIVGIPTMQETEFDMLAQAVLRRLYQKEPPFPALTEQEWNNRLNHTLAQADQGELRDARMIIAKIRKEYGIEAQ